MNDQDSEIKAAAASDATPAADLTELDLSDPAESAAPVAELDKDSAAQAARAEQLKKELLERKQQHEEMLAEFVDTLPSLVGLETCKINARLTREGLFLKEDFLRPVLLAFQRWLQVRTASLQLPSMIKAKKKLFHDENIHQVYLIEGKQTLTGYQLVCNTQNKRKLGIPYVDSRTLDATNFLHSRDPIFTSLAAVDLVIKSGGSEVEVTCGAEIYRFNLEAVKHFHQQAINSPIILRRFRKIREAQRYALVALVKVLRQTRALQDRKPLFVPVGTERYPAQAFRLYYDWVFVFDEHSFLRTCYELRGRNLDSFTNMELAYLVTKRNKELRNIRVFTNPGWDIAEIRVGNSSYKIGRRVLQALEKFYPFYINKHSKDNKRYSLASILGFFEKEFQQAYIVTPKEIAWLLRGGKVKARQYRFNKRWLFLLNDKHSVFNCLQVPGSYQDQSIVLKRPNLPAAVTNQHSAEAVKSEEEVLCDQATTAEKTS